MQVEDRPDLSVVKPDSKIPLVGPETIPIENCFDLDWFEGDKCHIEEIIPGAFYIDNILGEKECEQIIQFIDSSPALSFWSDAGRDNQHAVAFRDADTIEFQSSNVASVVWNRLKMILSTSKLKSVLNINFSESELDEFTGEISDSRWQVDLVGNWQPIGLNNDMLFARYPPHGSFAPHTDGTAIVDFNTRSFYSVVVYLNTVPQGLGAGTKFYKKDACQALSLTRTDTANGVHENWTSSDDNKLAEVDAVCGRFLFFDQQLVHEGVQPVAPFLKYIIRSDIMFRRSPELCTSPTDREAFEIYRKAEVLSEKGQTDEAITLFKRAFRLSPSFARIMQQA